MKKFKISPELEESLRGLKTPFVILGVGIPGSGKTTILKEIAERLGAVCISPDEIRKELTGSAADQSVNKETWGEAHKRAKENLTKGISVIMDATHAEFSIRSSLIQMYRNFGAVTVVALRVNVPLAIAKERNAKRQRKVPEYVLDRMQRSLTNGPPTKAEGFDEVIEVKN